MSRWVNLAPSLGKPALVFFTCAAILAQAPTALAVVKITPQAVVDLAMTRGTRAKGAELLAQRSYLNLFRALGNFDLQFNVTPSWEYNEAQTFNGVTINGNIIDRTWNLDAMVAKKFRTGTTLGIEYINTQQTSVLLPTSTRTARVVLDSVQASVRQPLWQDSFGYADRLALEVGQLSIDAALESRQENLEGIILDAMTLFWNTYIAERELQQNLSARDKYDQLVKNVRRKAGFNLSSPGELPRLEAEMNVTEQKVKASSSAYLNALADLMTAIRIETTDTIVIDAPTELPPVPQLKAKDLESLRAIKIARKNLEGAEKNLSLVQNQNRPRLDLVARARATGVEEDNGGALAEMQGGTKPYYYVGVEFSSPLDSDLIRGLVADADVARQQAANDLTTASDTTRDSLTSLERTVASQYSVAKSSIETVQLRDRVVRDLESAYRQGRQPLVELIRAYNDLFAAQSDRARAIGDYNIDLNKLAAARDELVTNAPPVKR